MTIIYNVGEQQDWLYLQAIRKEEPELWDATLKLIQAQAAQAESESPPPRAA